ncbi:MAG: sulfotransferase family protein [Microcoleaceae cyanobacterium]
MFIFGIGLSKTGTSSLSAGLEYLGYPCSHWGYPQSALRYEAGKLQVNLSKLLVEFHAYTDTPVARIFKLLDSAFPNSKFVLTVREENAWFESYSRWIGPEGKSHLTPGFSEYLHRDLYGSSSPDRELNIAAFKSFNQSVIEHFRDRPSDLLVMNIVEGEGWEKLCSFLGKPVPDLPFPRENVSKSKRS